MSPPVKKQNSPSELYTQEQYDADPSLNPEARLIDLLCEGIKEGAAKRKAKSKSV